MKNYRITVNGTSYDVSVEELAGGVAPVAAPVAAAPVAAPAEPTVDEGELVAAITAAICAYTGSSSDGFVVRSIRKINRRKR